jgi:hypothetical protein
MMNKKQSVFKFILHHSAFCIAFILSILSILLISFLFKLNHYEMKACFACALGDNGSGGLLAVDEASHLCRA